MLIKNQCVCGESGEQDDCPIYNTKINLTVTLCLIIGLGSVRASFAVRKSEHCGEAIMRLTVQVGGA